MIQVGYVFKTSPNINGFMIVLSLFQIPGKLLPGKLLPGKFLPGKLHITISSLPAPRKSALIYGANSKLSNSTF